MVRTEGWEAWLERQVVDLRREDLPEFLGSLERIRGRALLKLCEAPSPPVREAEPLLTAAAAAARLSLRLPRVYELVRRNQLPCVRIGRQLRFSPAALDAYLHGG